MAQRRSITPLHRQQSVAPVVTNVAHVEHYTLKGFQPRLVEEGGSVFAVPVWGRVCGGVVITTLLSFPSFISRGHRPRFVSSSTPGIKDTIGGDNAISSGSLKKRPPEQSSQKPTI